MNLVRLQDIKLAHRNLLHFYTLTMKNQKEKLKKPVPFTTASKWIKHLGINLPKETRDLYSENYKMLMKKLKMTQTDGKIHHVLGLEESILLKCTQSNLQIQCNPYQITTGIFFFFFYRIRTKKFTICMETEQTPNSQNNREKEKQSWRNQAPWLQSVLQSYSHQNVMVLAHKEKCRSMEQDRKSRNKPTHLWSINLW